MRIAQADLDAYRAELDAVARAASTSVRDALEEYGPDDGVTAMREAAVEEIMLAVGVHGEQAQALAGALFDEVCALEGIEGTEFLMYDDIVDYDMMESLVRWFARSLVEHDVGRFLDDCSTLADFYMRRCNYESMVRNCWGNDVRYARVPMGTETCDWCIMLASRGFVYYTQESAEHGMHLHCDCIVVPGVDGQTSIEGYDPDAYYDMYRASSFYVSHPGHRGAVTQRRYRGANVRRTGRSGWTEVGSHVQRLTERFGGANNLAELQATMESIQAGLDGSSWGQQMTPATWAQLWDSYRYHERRLS